jgi:hypothetical protein
VRLGERTKARLTKAHEKGRVGNFLSKSAPPYILVEGREGLLGRNWLLSAMVEVPLSGCVKRCQERKA